MRERDFISPSRLLVQWWSFAEHIKPEIIDSDQGTLYTCSLWVYPMKELKISLNKDG